MMPDGTIHYHAIGSDFSPWCRTDLSKFPLSGGVLSTPIDSPPTCLFCIWKDLKIGDFLRGVRRC